MNSGTDEQPSEEAPDPRKSEELLIRIWSNPKDKRIRMSLPDGRITTVADDGGERSHRHLYNHLRELLRKQGKWPEAGPKP